MLFNEIKDDFSREINTTYYSRNLRISSYVFLIGFIIGTLLLIIIPFAKTASSEGGTKLNNPVVIGMSTVGGILLVGSIIQTLIVAYVNVHNIKKQLQILSDEKFLSYFAKELKRINWDSDLLPNNGIRIISNKKHKVDFDLTNPKFDHKIEWENKKLFLKHKSFAECAINFACEYLAKRINDIIKELKKDYESI